ncbi:serpin B4-like isoform X2 [Carlito syrichta]|uniref:Serpin B4-like isoform X2 n=1 Tax=Carlito syrichta TaxID=1868482 RepID=A0A3Q0E9P6_CARSF|nr:serpin B4-like isoform X2 [Carlito syrichta]
MNPLTEAIIQFTLDLLQQFRKLENDNIFFSPFSISSSLAMVYLGARENTKQQIKEVLHFNEVTEDATEKATKQQVDKSENVHHQFQKLLTMLNKPTDDYELKIANKIYEEKTYQFLQEYLDDIKKFYLTSMESLDFINAEEESRKKINSWVESQTNGKIKDLFPNDSLKDVVLVLVNAVYFKGQWEEKFHKEHTNEEKFWVNKDVQAKILEIPYKGKDLSMIVLLPNEIDGLQKLEDELTAEKLIHWMSPQNMSERHVNLYLPRFKVEESYDLKDTLKAMGMVDAFSPPDADLSGMNGRHDLVVSKVLHKSFVEVTEEGAEAAAATGVTLTPLSMAVPQKFQCDHPFLFFIKQNKMNSILFFGRISSP